MARRRYYRRSVRVVAPKKKWATHFSAGNLTSSGEILASNATQGATPTPVIIKAGNFKVQGDVMMSSNLSAGNHRLMIYVAYVPEAYDLTSNILQYHPEWIMGWTAVDTSYVPDTGAVISGNKWSITSRLKRNLNSGDKIMLFYNTTASSSVSISINYNAQYWTCSN